MRLHWLWASCGPVQLPCKSTLPESYNSPRNRPEPLPCLHLLEVLLLIGHLLAVGDLGGPDLGLLLHVLARELHLGGLELHGVAEGVDHLLDGLELGGLGGLLGHPLGVALGLEAADVVLALLEHPGLGAELGAELVVVGDHHHAALELLDGAGERAERLAVEVVGGLVEDEDVGLVPHGGGEHDLDLLPARERLHAVVGPELAVQADVLEVLLDVVLGERALVLPLAERELLIRGLDVLAEAPLDKLVHGQELVGLVGLVNELDLVLVLLLHRAAGARELLDEELDLDHLARAVVDIHLDGLLALLDLLLGQGHGVLLDHLLVVAALVAPLDVLVGRLVQVLLDVVEGVLGHVGDAARGVLPRVAGLGHDLAGEELDHGGLAGAVGADARHARGEGHADGDVHDGGRLVDGVGVRHVVHLHKELALVLHALHEAGLGELELELGGGHVEVVLGLGLLLHEHGEVALVAVELEVLDLEHVRAAVVEEAGVVGHHDGGHGLERVEVVLHPRDVHHVEVVGGLVEEEDVGAHEHGAGERELHAPAAREGVHAVAAHLLVEAHGHEHLLDVLAGDVGGLDAGVGEDVVDAGEVGELALDVSLDEDGAELVGGGEALDLAVGDGAHERGLARVVLAQQAVVGAALELEVGVVEENLGAVGEGEAAVAQLLGVVVVVLLLLVLHVAHGHLEHVLASRGNLRLGLAREQGPEVGHPGLLGVDLVLDEAGDDGGDGGDHLLGALNVGGDDGGEGVLVALGLGGVGGLLNALELHAGLAALGAGLGVGDVLGGGLEGGEELGEEGRGEGGLENELGHVGADDRALALHHGGALLEPAKEEGHGDGQGRGGHGGHKHHAGQAVDGIGGVLGVGHGGDECGEEVLDIAVADGLAALGDDRVGAGLDVGLDVRHEGGHHGHNVREGHGALLGRLLHEVKGHLEGGDEGLGLLLGAVHGREVGGEREARGVGGRGGAKGTRGRGGSDLDGLDLVGAELEDLLEGGEEVGHHTAAAGGADGLEADRSGLALAGGGLAPILHGLNELGIDGAGIGRGGVGLDGGGDLGRGGGTGVSVSGVEHLAGLSGSGRGGHGGHFVSLVGCW
mmetsp:Transcript_5929/g.20180  ORF Transcript_5929/g.20180 Transcript_5929/m.20180 type:complete len:1091 (-) Transcript_5929:63-3335(-)